VPEVLRQKEVQIASNDAVNQDNIKEENISPDLISWMVKDGKTEMERDPDALTTLCGSVAAGSTYSIANFVCRTLSDLTAHPDVLYAIRSELRNKHAGLNGRSWNFNDLQSGLDCLESAMKETARLAPGTLIVYSRVVQRDYVFDKGGHEISLKKGQFITMSGMSRAKDPAIFEDPELYKGLRFCPKNDKDKLEEHQSKPFRSVDADILAWGSGRWACPGRLVADMAAKIVLIKLLDEYEFAFVDRKPLKPSCIHEFLFFHPDNKMLIRRRQDRIGIEF
jgi:cytochrome P450